MAKAVKSAFKRHGVDVIMTRSGNVTVSLSQRTNSVLPITSTVNQAQLIAA